MSALFGTRERVPFRCGSVEWGTRNPTHSATNAAWMGPPANLDVLKSTVAWGLRRVVVCA
jgi:hypothetical protein